jgi:hypothetical protein
MQEARGTTVREIRMPPELAPTAAATGSLEEQADRILSVARIAIWGDDPGERRSAFSLMEHPSIEGAVDGVARSTWYWRGGVSSILVVCEAHMASAWTGWRLVEIDCWLHGVKL